MIIFISTYLLSDVLLQRKCRKKEQENFAWIVSLKTVICFESYTLNKMQLDIEESTSTSDLTYHSTVS